MVLFWVLVASLTGLGIQWFWIAAAALRAARARTARSFERLRREVSELRRETEGGEWQPSVEALEAAVDAMSASLRQVTAGTLWSDRFQAMDRAFEAVQIQLGVPASARDEPDGFGAGATRVAAEARLRWGWVELAIWDCAGRLEEEQRCWSGPGARWVGRRLGLSWFPGEWSKPLGGEERGPGGLQRRESQGWN